MDKGSNRILVNENREDINGIKTKVAVMFIQVTHHIESKNFDKLKDLFVQIADLCTSLKEPDKQVLEWIEISCSCLGIMHRNSQVKKYKSTHSFDRKGLFTREGMLRLSYNKFTGEFEILQYEQANISQDVLQYVSKLNAILFGCQYVDNNNSLYTMFSLYWIPFTIAFVFLILSFIFLAVDIKSGEDQNNLFQMTEIIIGAILCIPLITIFLRVLEQKDSTFFEKKLGEEIQKINEDCRKRGIDLEFMKPHGREINVKLNRSDSQDAHIKSRSEKSSVLEEVQETPDDEQFMDKIKGLTHEISKISGASLTQFK